ncbi:orotate phosphoribosyltransferase [Melghiribacillus thermohalophilus]|uniref:Orotate phosphoribosyltransferase n=1 Tax=Melghiribacillus thermohalophilus TaxID=1324956 RepID=A0A4R3NB63_9BACI|nr:orotate phosphoribosyltransferase [Melghiribacillus thermohalophilus]TCT26837.1 orotate phosphoribosyltransferase [Melghiribacillus thermohalophilus]
MNRQEFAKKLLEIDALQVRPDRPFTWTSGIQSPIYCDNRLTMSYPELRRAIAQGFAEKIKKTYPKTEVIAGCATAGIPHAAWVSEILNLPMVYVRSKAKSHGKQNQIEGKIHEGQKVVVIEDLISTGKSSLQASTALEEAGARVLGVLSIFTYGLSISQENFKKHHILYDSLTDFDTLVDIMIEAGQLNDKEKEDLLKWRNNL